MMKTLSLFLLLSLASFSVMAQNKSGFFPSYEDIVNNFFSQYSINDKPENAQIEFHKRPDGWHVAVVTYNPFDSIVKDELFWVKKTSKYNKINFQEIGDEIVDFGLIESYLENSNAQYYKICPYFGYPGWDWDIIQEYKNKTNLSDTTLYGLGRAYSSYASNLLNRNRGMANKTVQFNLPAGKNSMTDEQLTTYRFYRHLAISTFESLALKNPRFSTIVGEIGIKASNEYLNSFLDFRMYQNEAEALKELKTGLYNPQFLAGAKNLLNSCAPNAILFTDGDNATYPLLYIQSILGFRKDVTVVNMSLLMTDRYINSLREQILDAKAPPISFSAEQIEGEKRNVIVIIQMDSSAIEVADLISFIKNEENIKELGTMKYYYSPSSIFRISSTNGTVEWQINSNYFFRNHLILLDILEANHWERPIYFSNTMMADYYFGLEEYLRLEGLVYRLGTEKRVIADNLYCNVNTEEMYQNLMNLYDWSELSISSSTEVKSKLNYRANFAILATALLNEQKPDLAKTVLNKCNALINNDSIPFDNIMISLVGLYYQLSAFEKGNTIARQIMNKIHTEALSQGDNLSLEQAEYWTKIYDKLKELAAQYNQHEMLSEIETFMNK